MDLHDDVYPVTAIAPVSLGATGGGGKVSKIIDRGVAGGFDALEFLLNYGAVTATGATVGVTAKDGDATGALSAVTSSILPGVLTAGLTATAARVSGVSKNVAKRFGYFGIRRYVQIALAPSVSGGIIASATALLAIPRSGPAPGS